MTDTVNNNSNESTESKTLDDSVEQKISDLERQLKDKDAKYLYLYAEFENFKKRAAKEREEYVKYGLENIASNLLEVLDNLERALAFMPEGADKNLVSGLKMVQEHFISTLKKQGVEKINALKQGFDPNLHEAVSQEPSNEPAGTVTSEVMSGYTLNGRLLRPSRVVVSAGQGS